MSKNYEDKKRVCIAIVVCSTALLLRSCNGNVNKKPKEGVVIDPPHFEEITFDDIFIPAEQVTIDPEKVPQVQYYYEETTTSENQNNIDFEETTTNTRIK